MNKTSKANEIIFAVIIGAILAPAIWWVLGGFILPIALCGVDNDKQCDPTLVNAISVVISLLIAATLTAVRIHRILKK
jgi:hypothetical protein